MTIQTICLIKFNIICLIKTFYYTVQRPVTRGVRSGRRRRQEHFMRFLWQLSASQYFWGRGAHRGRGRGRG